jgi:hypothetical protein
LKLVHGNYLIYYRIKEVAKAFEICGFVKAVPLQLATFLAIA